ncbi:MAG TPA: uroporphyrinogen decarboxylase family protein [Armatimonadota bacterium]|nr:uroporphyrinogen decarboxylase family protein [Armatimonadota bacterium]
MPPETTQSRFRKVLAGEKPADRLPVVEWAMWWHLTLNRWRTEGLPPEADGPGVKRFFDLDLDYQLWFPQMAPGARRQGGDHWITDDDSYDRLRPYLYPDPPPVDWDLWRRRAAVHVEGGCVFWITLEGFFWWPRVLFGIEPHLLAFYDRPDLMRRINQDQVEYQIRCLRALDGIATPDFMTFAEDMSYNHGTMISREQFDAFMAPYYRQIIPELNARGITPLVDSDGDIEPLVPWLESVDVRGILPLERMAGVDVNRLRQRHPDWIMIGGFDKTVMHRGEAALRAEFERLMPVMKSGRFIPSVDHQTPPAVSIEDYRLYLDLLREYAARAVDG